MKVSVIVPVWNVEPFLRRCVDSVIAQTHRDLEIILVDDGSPDNCPAICDELATADSRIMVIHQTNRGVSVSRNVGLDVATGEYVKFVDGDDALELDAIETLLKTAMRDQSDFVICGHSIITYDEINAIINNNLRKLERPGIFSKNEFLQRLSCCTSLVSAGWVYCWDKMFALPFLNERKIRFPEEMRFCEDRLFNLNCIAHCRKVSAISECLCRYYIPSSNHTRATASTVCHEGRWMSHQRVFDGLHDLLEEKGCFDRAAQKFVNQNYVNTMVVEIYRCCRVDNGLSFTSKVRGLKRITSHPMVRNSLRTYARQSPKEDKFMPVLMWFNNSLLTFLYAAWKSKRIYQKKD